MEAANFVIRADRKVADFVTENPLTAKVFYLNGIEFCCGGQISLAEACANRGLSLDLLISDLEKVPLCPEEYTVSKSTRPSNVINFIVKNYNRELKKDLPVIKQLLEKVIIAHSKNYSFLNRVKNVFTELVADLEIHLEKEESVLFPLIKELDYSFHFDINPIGTLSGAIQHPIEEIEQEHEKIVRLLGIIQSETGGYMLPDNACNTFAALYASIEKMQSDLYLHMHMENNILHVMAKKLEKKLFGEG